MFAWSWHFDIFGFAGCGFRMAQQCDLLGSAAITWIFFDSFDKFLYLIAPMTFAWMYTLNQKKYPLSNISILMFF